MGLLQRIKNAVLGRSESNRGYALADIVGSTRFYGQKYSGGLPASANLVIDSARIREQVRTLTYNSLQLRALIERDVDTVVGDGLNLIAEPNHKILGITADAAKEWANKAEQGFALWAMSSKASRSGRYNFFQAQRLIRKSLNRDGEVFVALSYHNDKNLISPLRFELIDSDQIRENNYISTKTGSSMKLLNGEGITRNTDGEEVSYKVWSNDKTGAPAMVEIPKIGRSGRIMMLHGYSGMDYAGQLRGISPYAGCIQDFEHILNFTLAHINKSINISNIAFTVESKSDQPAKDPFLGMKNLVKDAGVFSGRASEKRETGVPNDSETSCGKTLCEEEICPTYTEIPHSSFNKPGSIGLFSLQSKEQLKALADPTPLQALDSFINTLVAYIASATGQSIETTLMRFSHNYSASRATLLLVWRIAEERRAELDAYILGHIYQMYIAEEIAAGRLSAPGWADPRLRAAWLVHRFSGDSMPDIDPSRSAEAKRMYAEMGSTTYEEIALKYNDSNFYANCMKQKQEVELLRSIGSLPWSKDKPIAEGDEKQQGEEGE